MSKDFTNLLIEARESSFFDQKGEVFSFFLYIAVIGIGVAVYQVFFNTASNFKYFEAPIASFAKDSAHIQQNFNKPMKYIHRVKFQGLPYSHFILEHDNPIHKKIIQNLAIGDTVGFHAKGTGGQEELYSYKSHGKTIFSFSDYKIQSWLGHSLTLGIGAIGFLFSLFIVYTYRRNRRQRQKRIGGAVSI